MLCICVGEFVHIIEEHYGWRVGCSFLEYICYNLDKFSVRFILSAYGRCAFGGCTDSASYNLV
jgi:hypothetical protein